MQVAPDDLMTMPLAELARLVLDEQTWDWSPLQVAVRARRRELVQACRLKYPFVCEQMVLEWPLTILAHAHYAGLL